jgi:beta-catenin-like protein 1
VIYQSKKKKADAAIPASEETSHVLGIISSLFTSLASDSPERLRLLTKFVEADYEKVDRLLDVRESAENRLKVTEKEIERERRVRRSLRISKNLLTLIDLGYDSRWRGD